MMREMAVVCAAILVGTAAEAKAGFLLDFSPNATGALPVGVFRNIADGQNFAERILFGSGVLITGMDIYSLTTSRPEFAPGFSVTIRLWADNGGIPGLLLHEREEPVSVIDTLGVGSVPNVSRYKSDFASSLALSANTRYWIGMSGTSVEFGMLGLGGPNAPDDGAVYQMNVGSPSFQAIAGDMAFRLYGDIQAVPEPSSVTLFGTGAMVFAAGTFWRRGRSLWLSRRLSRCRNARTVQEMLRDERPAVRPNDVS